MSQLQVDTYIREKSRAVMQDPAQNSQFYAFFYHDGNIEEKALENEEEFFQLRECWLDREGEGSFVSWLNVVIDGDEQLVSRLQKRFSFHHLVREDIIDTEQRPKCEEFSDHVYMSLKMLSLHEYNGEQHVSREQLSTCWFEKGIVLTVQERFGDTLQDIRYRLRNARGRIRKRKSPYLFYTLLRTSLKEYDKLLETLSERTEDIESSLFQGNTEVSVLENLYTLRRQLIRIRKAALPLREVISELESFEQLTNEHELQVYLRSAQDEVMHIKDTIQGMIEILSSLTDFYMSTANMRMSITMKILALVSIVFTPLNLIAAIYGMNFKIMPELNWTWGYFGVLGLMLMIASGNLFFFRSRGWFR